MDIRRLFCGGGPRREFADAAEECASRAAGGRGRTPKVASALSMMMLDTPCELRVESVGRHVPAGCDCYVRCPAMARELGYKPSRRTLRLTRGDVLYVVVANMLIPREARELPGGCEWRAFRVEVL